MITLADLQNEINEVVSIDEEYLAQTEGGGRVEIPTGFALAVCTGYVTIGEHTNSNGDSKPQAKLFFELFDLDGGDKYTRTIKQDGEEIIRGAQITHNLHNISRNEKAGFRKDIDALMAATGQDGETSALKLLGKHVLVEVVHNPDKKDPKKFYVNLEISKCKAPFNCNAVGEPDLSKPMTLPVNPMGLPMRMFLFEAPTPTQWSTIFIEGEYEVEGKDGTKETRSKNWLQEKIKSADNFQGSAVESLLMQQGNTGTPLPTAKKAKKVTEPEVPTDAPVEKVAENTSEKAVEAVSKTSVGLTPEEQDELVRLRDTKSMLEMSGLPADDVDAKIALLESKQ